MKDFIVIIATIILGVVLAAIIIGLKKQGKTLGDGAVNAIDGLDLTTTVSD